MKKILFGAAMAALFLSACNNKSETAVTAVDSTSIKNKAAAMNSDLAFAKRDLASAFKDYSTDYVEYGNGSGKPIKNMDTIKAHTQQFFDAFPDFKGDSLHAVAEGDSVLITGIWSGTFKKAFMGMKPTQKSFKLNDVDVFTFNKEGKITSHSSVQSDFAFFGQLGIPIPAKK